MPSALFDIELESPVAEVADIYRSAASNLVDDVFKALDAMAVQLGHRGLRDFWGKGWHDGDEGLPTVRALKEHIERSPESIFNPNYSLERLRLWERMFAAAQQAGVRWKFDVELG